MRTFPTAAALLVAAAVALVACGSGSGSSASPKTEISDATTTTSTSTSTVVPDTGPQIDVRVVADSEVPDAVSALLDDQPGIEVSSMLSVNGATMATLDGWVDEALAEEPDVLVYSGGTNDLGAGPLEMLAGLQERLTRYAQQTCVVMAVPIFRYERGTEAEVKERTQGTHVLEEAALSTGVRVASYLDVSLAMDEDGRDFFAEGELGDMHPGPAAYPGIAAAIAEQVRACA